MFVEDGGIGVLVGGGMGVFVGGTGVLVGGSDVLVGGDVLVRFEPGGCGLGPSDRVGLLTATNNVAVGVKVGGAGVEVTSTSLISKS